MKRYRVVEYDFDSRSTLLNVEIKDEWKDNVKEQWLQNKKSIESEFIADYGIVNSNEKLTNFKELGNKPFSVIAFHNIFFQQIRSSYVIGSYYPALTATCALGERILNHLILKLRKYFTTTNEYKKIYRKNSFDNWDVAIDTLNAWGVLLPEVVGLFKGLKDIRHSCIHFSPDIDKNDKNLALEAILILQRIIDNQFSCLGFGGQPWFIEGLDSAFIKLEYESNPFVKEILLPKCRKVGHLHKLEFTPIGWKVIDSNDYSNINITDERFALLMNNPNKYDANNNEVFV
jgi:hypothetical protein